MDNQQKSFSELDEIRKRDMQEIFEQWKRHVDSYSSSSPYMALTCEQIKKVVSFMDEMTDEQVWELLDLVRLFHRDRTMRKTAFVLSKE